MVDDDSSARVADPQAHIEIDDLADLSEDLLPPGRASVARAHLQTCASCREQLDDLGTVTAMLAASPAPPIPEAVVLRLDEVIAAEHARRSVAPLPPRPRLGSFAPDTRGSHRGLGRLRAWQTALVAATVAALVGFGGYVASASAGLNEPTIATAAYVRSEDLSQDAAALARRDGLDAYLFSPSWRCAARVVDGRITGLIPAYVDGEQALLVYSRSGGKTQVTVVRGCPGRSAVAGSSAVLPG